MPLFFCLKGGTNMNKITGHYHISMITKKGQQNNQFYQKLLGHRRT